MKIPRISGRFGLGHSVELKSAMPQWCASCNKYVSDQEPHDDTCATVLEPLVRKARARQRGELPFAVYLKLYGVFICVAAMSYIVWRLF